MLQSFGTPDGCVTETPAPWRQVVGVAAGAGGLLLLAHWNPLDWLGAVHAGLRVLFGG